jgi:alpha-tubulin suppressor-like RCC1 family protein
MMRFNTNEDRLEIYNGYEWELYVYVNQITSIAYAWGTGNEGQLGDGASGISADRFSPFIVLGGITNWSQVSAGGDSSGSHSLAVTRSGIAYAWGANVNGRLGDNTTSSRLSPVTVVGGITNWSQVSAGGTLSLGLTDTGISYAWGLNTDGQLGDNTTTSRLSPVTVVGGITNWSQVSAGGFHSLGLTSDGIAYAWGRNNSGQLGTNNTSSRSSPVTVVGGITNWSQLSAGSTHSLGLTSAGIAYAWGYRGSGRLGDGANTTRSSPVTVVGGITNWSHLSGGIAHSLGLTSTGIAYGWGINTNGQLGDNTLSSRSSPVTVVGGVANWRRVSAGDQHSLGITTTGVAYGWGRNLDGFLGDGTGTGRSSPVTVVGGITSWSQVSAGFDHSLGLRTDLTID